MSQFKKKLQGYPLQKQLNFQLRRMVEAGMVKYWADHVLVDKISETYVS